MICFPAEILFPPLTPLPFFVRFPNLILPDFFIVEEVNRAFTYTMSVELKMTKKTKTIVEVASQTFILTLFIQDLSLFFFFKFPQ